MIDFLSNWIEEITISIIIISIFEMIIPNGNIKKYVKIILGIYLIFSIISPFVDSEKLYSIDVSKTIDNYTEEISNSNLENKENYDNSFNSYNNYSEDMNKIYAKTLEEQISKTVEKQGYNVHKCSVKGIFDSESKKAGISKIEIIIESKKEIEEEKNKESENVDIENINKINPIEINIGEKSIISKNSQEITLKDITDLKKYLSEHYEIDKKIIDIQKM